MPGKHLESCNLLYFRIEGSQMADRTTDKMWLVCHLEVIRQLTVEDLRVIKVRYPCLSIPFLDKILFSSFG